MPPHELPSIDDGPTLAAMPPDIGEAPAYAGCLRAFRTGAHTNEASQQGDQRHSRRAADQITTSFYEACRVGNMTAARQLMQALEREIVRSSNLFGGDWREDSDDVVEVRARYRLEMARQSASFAAAAPKDAPV